MDRSIPMLLIGLVFGGGIGFVVAAANGITLDGHDHGAGMDHGAAHSAGDAHAHGPAIELPAGSAAVGLTLEKDTVAGWNLFVATQGFCFAPDQAGKPNAAGQGHAHLYLDGTKIARLYGPAQHLDSLPAGGTLRVELNGNDHSPLAIDGQPLAASVTVPADTGPASVHAGQEALPRATLCP